MGAVAVVEVGKDWLLNLGLTVGGELKNELNKLGGRINCLW